ncbi:hypothetical protein BZG02_06500 [Labilibaculum filiforme]|uniref:Hydrolase TatD n=1 Tax=Labilibaculum filiforme TaxID=1940526 RepID=A0A2N3I2L2_9BACT|nr:hypothetical protein BZG02_06500 [Labilibaculum filiforme]
MPFINIHTHNFSIQSNVRSIFSIHPEEKLSHTETAYYSIGIHPWNIETTAIAATMNKMEEMVVHPAILAIGEIGLDRMITAPLSIQEKIFQQQLQLAEKYEKPVIIHCVKCFSELIRIRKKGQFQLPWIIHGFVKNQKIAEDLIELACYLSFGKALLINEQLQQLFKTLPSKNIFLETDDSAIEIEELYKKAAAIKNLEIEDLKKELLSNFKTCFNK